MYNEYMIQYFNQEKTVVVQIEKNVSTTLTREVDFFFKIVFFLRGSLRRNKT